MNRLLLCRPNAGVLPISPNEVQLDVAPVDILAINSAGGVKVNARDK
jgi:hypothetical protein